MSEFDNIYEGLNAPYSLDSEQSVLGAVLLDPNCMNDEKVAELKPEHFYLPQHKAIFSTLFAMSQLNKPMDFVTILEELRSSGSYEQAGGISCPAGTACSVGGKRAFLRPGGL